MNNENSLFIIHTEFTKHQKEYYIKTKWSNAAFDLTILDTNEAFQSHVSFEYLNELAIKYEFTIDEYRTELQKSLLQKNDNSLFLYERRNLEFVVSRRENGFIREIICVRLEKLDFQQTTFCFIDEMNLVISNTKNQLRACKNELDRVTKEKNDCQNMLENFVRDKTEMEQNLYSHFLLVLNEKKLRIQQLEETLQCPQTAASIRKETLSDSESSKSSDPDDELNQPSTSFAKKQNLFPLFQEEDDNIMDILPVRGKSVQITSIPKQNETKEEHPEKEVTKNRDSQEFLEFTTQDLLSRL